MCYQPADPSCPAEYPVLCDEVAPHAPKQDDHTVTTLPPSDTITSTTTMTMETMMWIESTTATTSLRYVASTSPPTEPTTMRTTTADVFNGAMDQAAVAAIMVAEETPYPSGPRGWYCGLLGGVISLVSCMCTFWFGHVNVFSLCISRRILSTLREFPTKTSKGYRTFFL